MQILLRAKFDDTDKVWFLFLEKWFLRFNLVCVIVIRNKAISGWNQKTDK